MAKVIKRGGGTQKPSSSSPAPRQTAKRTGKVIDRQVYQAQQDAQEIITAGENEKRQREEAGVQSAQQAYEEHFVQAQASTEAELAGKLIQIFQQRRLLVATALEDVQTLSVEIIHKILGAPLQLGQAVITQQTQEEEATLLGRRTLSVGIPAEVHQKLKSLAPDFLDALTQCPDIELSDTEGQTSLGWVAVNQLRFAIDARDLLSQLGESLGMVLPDLNPPEPASSTAPALLEDEGEDSVVEKTMAISLEELKSMAEAAKKRKKSED
ncbi:MAG: hypothetical protein CMH56_00155 [Myxococcales bacterium]|nr:hypothetical protein [Myxococcales bacterium]